MPRVGRRHGGRSAVAQRPPDLRSPDGSLLVVATSLGGHVYAVERGFAEAQRPQEGVECGAAFDGAGSRCNMLPHWSRDGL